MFWGLVVIHELNFTFTFNFTYIYLNLNFTFTFLRSCYQNFEADKNPVNFAKIEAISPLLN